MFHYVVPKTKIVRSGARFVLLCGNVVQSTKTLIGRSITERHEKTVVMVSYQEK